VTGDAQTRIDVYADEVMLGAVDVRQVVAAASPEEAGLVPSRAAPRPLAAWRSTRSTARPTTT
jgi:hypothetical protein